MKSSYLPIIGIEVHVELRTKSKMFCSCPNNHFGQKPNTNVCPVCLGLPGALPVPNLKAIEETIILATAFNCQINKNFWFDRKNYFYPDLPKGYQISQHFAPIAINGKVPVLTEKGFSNIGVSDIHLEEDTGKSQHKTTETWLDYNRSGVPLVEIVSKPEIHSSEEAKDYLKRIQQTIRWLGLSDCDMEKGSMRLEANISVKRSDDKSNLLPNYRVEVKNLNSFRFVEKAINYEVNRQIKIIKKGGHPSQETRGFNPRENITFAQRSKEVAKDYRYFPEPDIPPFVFTSKQITNFKNQVKETPWQTEKQILSLGIKWHWVKILVKDKAVANLFLKTVKLAKGELSVQEIASWMVNKKVSSKTKPSELIKQVNSNKNRFDLPRSEMTAKAKEVIKESAKAVTDYQKGKVQVIGFLIGQLQRKTNGKSDPALARKILQDLLSKNKK